jgi:hypothetical protein
MDRPIRHVLRHTAVLSVGVADRRGPSRAKHKQLVRVIPGNARFLGPQGQFLPVFDSFGAVFERKFGPGSEFGLRNGRFLAENGRQEAEKNDGAHLAREKKKIRKCEKNEKKKNSGEKLKKKGKKNGKKKMGLNKKAIDRFFLWIVFFCFCGIDFFFGGVLSIFRLFFFFFDFSTFSIFPIFFTSSQKKTFFI